MFYPKIPYLKSNDEMYFKGHSATINKTVFQTEYQDFTQTPIRNSSFKIKKISKIRRKQIKSVPDRNFSSSDKKFSEREKAELEQLLLFEQQSSNLTTNNFYQRKIISTEIKHNTSRSVYSIEQMKLQEIMIKNPEQKKRNMRLSFKMGKQPFFLKRDKMREYRDLIDKQPLKPRNSEKQKLGQFNTLLQDSIFQPKLKYKHRRRVHSSRTSQNASFAKLGITDFKTQYMNKLRSDQ